MKKQLSNVLHRFGKYLKVADNQKDTDLYKELYNEEALINKRFYNVGAGEFSHPFWTNVDGDSEWYSELNNPSNTHIVHDFFDHKPLPVPDNSAEIIYTSHTLEHIDNASVQYLLNDFFRMLKKGGVLRIVTPDMDRNYKAWQKGDKKYYFWTEWESVNKDFQKQCLNMPLGDATISQIFLEDFAAAASEIALEGAPHRINDSELNRLFKELPYEQALDHCISLCSIELQRKYPFRHMNWFNEKKFTKMLTEAGFKTIIRSAYLQSEVPVLRNHVFFDRTLPQISLYMEVVK